MAINSQGSVINYSGPGSPAAYAPVEQVKSITGPSGTVNLIDVSHLGSTRKEFLPGLADNGSLTLSCNFTYGTVQMALFDAFNAHADPAPFRLDVPHDATLAAFYRFFFNGIVTKWELTEGVDKAVDLNISIQTTGGVTYTPT